LNELKGIQEYEQLDRDTSEVVMWDKNDPSPIELPQASEVANDSPPSLKVPEMPINKDEIVSKLWNYIMSIYDDNFKKSNLSTTLIYMMHQFMLLFIPNY
jgi:hypothetical protein